MSSEKKRWYVLQVQSLFEKRVKESIEQIKKQEGLEDFIGDVLVPTEEVIEMKAGQKRKTERKFFPGYVLINMLMNDETWHVVRNIPRVLGFIGGAAGKATPISQKEVDNIMARVQADVDAPKPKTLYEVGEVILVNDGPFEGFNGAIEEVNYEKGRMRVSVNIFGRSTPVELEFSQVDKMS